MNNKEQLNQPDLSSLVSLVLRCADVQLEQFSRSVIMKTLLCAATIAFTVASSLSATIMGGAIAPAAFAAEMACQTTLKPSTTGGMAREALDMTQTCQMTQSEQDGVRPVSMIQPSASVERPSQMEDTTYPGYCPTLPSWVQPGDAYYRDAIERCKYGS